MERQLGVTEARKQFAQMIDEVKYKGDNYIIVRHGEPAAAVVPVEVYLQWRQVILGFPSGAWIMPRMPPPNLISPSR